MACAMFLFDLPAEPSPATLSQLQAFEATREHLLAHGDASVLALSDEIGAWDVPELPIEVQQVYLPEAYPVEVYDLATELGTMAVDAMIPRLQERIPELVSQAKGELEKYIPELSQKMVDTAGPMMITYLQEHQEQINEAARQAAQSVVSDPQIQATVRDAVAETTGRMRIQMATGFFLATAAILLGTWWMVKK